MPEPNPKSPDTALNGRVLERISIALSGLRFGSLEIIVQDGKVVQIERKEKFRFDRPAEPSNLRHQASGSFFRPVC